MRIILLFFSIAVLAGCSVSNSLEFQNSKLIIIDSDEHSLLTKPDLKSPIANTIKKGSILFYNSNENQFIEVYTRNPKNIPKGNHKAFRYYIHNPTYSDYTSHYNNKNASLVELPFDKNKYYIRGERGGCYYLNTSLNKTYVNRSYCSEKYKKKKAKTINKSYKPKSTYKRSSTCGARTKSGGYCRRKVSGGGRCYQH